MSGVKQTPDTIDQYSFLDYKPAMQSMASNRLVKSWVPEDDRRRLLAYMLLTSYVRNNARMWLNSGVDGEEIADRREYGDPEMMVDTILGSLIGEEQNLWVEGAVGEFEPDEEAVFQLELLEQWALDEQFLMKMIECERDTVTLGDGVYVLGWDEKKQRPRLRVYDPGFFFPVIDENDDGFPRKVHIAYEFDRVIDRETVTFIRRITWELVETEDVRTYPWETEGENVTCIMQDGEWRMDDVKDGLLELENSTATWLAEPVDLLINFLPVIHMTNNIAGKEYFGTSSLSKILQVLDDLVSSDTDLQAASATTGTPPIAVGGVALNMGSTGELETYGPGTLLRTGDGTATLIDTSNSLDALMKYVDHLLSRVSVNGRIPEALIGRVKPNEVPSGIALTLSFTPHSQMIKEMRLVRDTKYRILFKFIIRMFMRAGVFSTEKPARLIFGSFLPADASEAATLVNQLYRTEKPMVSLETAVEMLVQAGIPIEDAAKEVIKIQQDDFSTANQMLDATGDVRLVYDRLGISSSPVVPEAVPLDEGVPPQEEL